MANVLAVSNDPRITDTLKTTLAEQGYAFHSLGNPDEILATMSQFLPDILVLDSTSYSGPLADLCRNLRTKPVLSGKPILLITEAISPEEAAELFELGIDDLMRKPKLAEKELAARVRALIRTSERPAGYNRAAQLKLIAAQHVVIVNGRSIILTPIEYQLLSYLCENRNQYYTAESLLDTLWQYPDMAGDTALVRNHIRNLRRKLEVDPDHPQILISRYGQGYTVRAVVQQS